MREEDRQKAARDREFETLTSNLPPSDWAGTTDTHWGFFGLCVAPAVAALTDESSAALLPLVAPLAGCARAVGWRRAVLAFWASHRP